jgi:hypothetical protein
MSSPMAEVLPKHLYTPVAPSLLHERQFNILLIQSQTKDQQKKKQRTRASSEKYTKSSLQDHKIR